MVRSEPSLPTRAASPRIATLTNADIAEGLALSDAAGWNQTADDWAVFIGSGRAIGLHDDEARLLATAAALGYGHRAWISMVLVAAQARHRGLATTLMAHCIASVQGRGETPVLDATPAGATVYGKLGFAAGFAFDRWEGLPDRPVDAGRPAASAERAALHGPGHAALLERVALLDAAAHGVDRQHVLGAFLSRADSRVWLTGDGQGFAIARAGRRAWQLGPLVAAHEHQAGELLGAALDDLAAPGGGRVFVDVPEAHRMLAALLSRRGFTVQRPFVRMALGDPSASRLAVRSFALAGPEYG